MRLTLWNDATYATKRPRYATERRSLRLGTTVSYATERQILALARLDIYAQERYHDTLRDLFALSNLSHKIEPVLPPSLTIRGLIFDLDGVLIVSGDCHRQAFEEVLADFGISGFNYNRFAGWRTADVFRAVFQERPEPVSSHTILQCSHRKTTRARELLAARNPIPSDCIPVLRRLSGKYRLGLASSGSRGSVEGFLERTGLQNLFQSVLSGDDVSRAKPDPEIVSRSVSALDLAAEVCAFIDDAVAGIQAGHAAGVCTIGFGTENARELRAAGAEFVVGSLTAIAAWLDGQ